MNKNELLQRVNEKREKLQELKVYLKQNFIGLDDVIDQIIFYMETWYCFPELMQRPNIICLWGMTGTGKTDLVRKIVDFLQLGAQFVEIQMSSDQYNREGSIDLKYGFDEKNIMEDEEVILLIDEFQRYRTLNEVKHEVDRSKLNYNDLWEFLSEGKIPFTTIHEVKYFLSYLAFKDPYNEAGANIIYNVKPYNRKSPFLDNIDKFEEESLNEKQFKLIQTKVQNLCEKNSIKLPNLPFDDAKTLKEIFDLKDSIEKIMYYNIDDVFNIYKEYMLDPKKYSKLKTHKHYKNLLVFVVGNLDEVYTMSNDIFNEDLTADIYHEYSKKINIFHVKKALTERFYPEQIARLGNNHIIYPVLNKNNFEQLIEKELNSIKKDLLEKTNIEVIFDKSVNDIIYKNGVFPAQGIRPLFTTIGYFSNVFIKSFIDGLENNINKIKLFYEYPNIKYDLIKSSHSKICAGNKIIKDEISNDIVESKYINIKWNVTDLYNKDNYILQDKDIIACVHEAGHCLMYCLLYNIPPMYVVGYNLDNCEKVNKYFNYLETVDDVTNMISIAYSGLYAEQLIFNEDNVTLGSIQDVEDATDLATKLIRDNDVISHINNLWGNITTDKVEDPGVTNIHESNKNIIDLLHTCAKECEERLMNFKQVLLILANELRKKHKLYHKDIYDILKIYLPNLKTLDKPIFDKDIVVSSFSHKEHFDKLLKENNIK